METLASHAKQRFKRQGYLSKLSISDINGYYVSYMAGKNGQSIVFFVIENGSITGVDPHGTTFDAILSLDESGQYLVGTCSVSTPPRVSTITGVETGETGIRYELPIQLPRDFLSIPFVRIETPYGPVNVKLEKVRNLPNARN